MKKFLRCAALALVALLAGSAAPQQGQAPVQDRASAETKRPSDAGVEITAEPSHHLVLQNDRVRAFYVEVAPHAETLLHRHKHDYLGVILGDSEVESRRVGEAPVTLRLKDGEALLTKGGFAHSAKDLAETPFRNATIELLQGAGEMGPPWNGPQNRQKKFVLWTERVVVWRNELPPGEATPLHSHHNPHLVVGLTDASLRNEVGGKGNADLDQKVGEIAWVPGGFRHRLVNTGKSAARFVSIEFVCGKDEPGCKAWERFDGRK